MISESNAMASPGGGVDAAAVHGPRVHVSSPKVLLGVWGGLVCLTVLTVAVTWIDMGPMNLVVALAIAFVKASLVALFFMHLRWERPLYAVVFLTAVLFVVLFVSLTLFDTLGYRSAKIPGYAPRVTGER